MKASNTRLTNKCYELNDNISYKRKNIDFNEYSLNKYVADNDNLLDHNAKTGPGCVKNKIKR